MRAASLMLALGLLCMVAGPLRADLPSWAWSWWLLAGVWALAFGPRRGRFAIPSVAVPAMWCLILACVIDAVMALWHSDSWIILRQDSKVLLGLWVACVLMARLSVRSAWGAVVPWGVLKSPTELREALAWAIGLQMVVAAAVAIEWPRAWLPATPIPWATVLALGLAVLAPLALGRLPAAPEGTAWRVGLGLAVLAGAVAVVLSRSRAAWVILPWLGLLWIVMSPRKGLAMATVMGVGLAAVGAGLWYDHLQPVQVERGIRLLDLLTELMQWREPDAGSSVGSRLLLWEAAWNSLWAHPWAGIGITERIAMVQQVVPPEQLREVAPLVHVHQQFLNQAVDHGVPGLVASMLCAAAPFAMAWRALPGVMRWQCLGVGVVHLTGLMFNANMTHGTYAVGYAISLMVVLWMHADALHEGVSHD